MSTFAGLSLWLTVVISVLPWVLILGRRFGYRLIVASSIIFTLWLVLSLLIVTALFGFAMNQTVVIAFAAFGIFGCFRASRSEPLPSQSVRPRIGPWVASAAGAVIWGVAQTISSSLPVYERLNWVMRNDSLANLLFARETIYRGGIATGTFENPAPLPTSLVALTANSGRLHLPGASLLEHDLSAMALTWGFLIAATCVLAGLVSAAIVRRSGASAKMETVGAFIASLSVLSWYFTGYPMEYGFLNTHVTLVVLLSALLVYLNSDRAPVLAVGVLAFAVTLTLASWSPLVVIPLGLALALVLSRWGKWWGTRKWRLVWILGATLQTLIFGVLVSLPTFLAQRSALGAGGGVFDPGSWVFIVSGGATVLTTIVVFRRHQKLELFGLFAVVAMSGLGLLLLLVLNRHLANPWSYYPVKFAWLSSLLFFVILSGLLLSILSRFPQSVWARSLGFGALAVMLVLLLVFTPTVPHFATMNPIDRLLRSQQVERYPEANAMVFKFNNPNVPTVLWQYSDWGEGEVDLWLLQLWANSLSKNNELRNLSYSTYFDRSVESLCKITMEMKPNPVVITANPNLESEYVAACPAGKAKFEIRAKPDHTIFEHSDH